jgi:hypothetical protein
LSLARRQFLVGLFAAPAIVRASSLMHINPAATRPFVPYMDALVESFNQTKQLVAARSLCEIRDLLLPGVREIVGKYADISGQYDKILVLSEFGGRCPDLTMQMS